MSKTLAIIGASYLQRPLVDRAKQMGFDATKTFEDRLTQLITKNEESND